MAKVQNPLHSGSASGKFSSQVHYPSHGSHCIRAYVSPPDPATAAQLAHRARISACHDLWLIMAQSDRDAWTRFAADVPLLNRDGRIRPESGYSRFTKLNSTLLRVGAATIEDVPALPSPTDLVFFAATGYPGRFFSIDWLNQPNYNFEYALDLWISDPTVPTRHPTPQECTFFLPIDVQDEYYEGQTDGPGYHVLYARLLHKNTGWTGPWKRQTFTNTA